MSFHRQRIGVLVALMVLAAGAHVHRVRATHAQDWPNRGGRQARLDVKKDPAVGHYVVDDGGRSLYMFTADRKNESSCYDRCAEKWPPLLTSDDPALDADALSPELLSTIERRDGARQVTYGGWPLYYYYEDMDAGDTTGQDVHDSGGEWYLVTPEGKKLDKETEE